MVLMTGELPVFWAANDQIVPVPVAARPILVLLLVQA